MSEMEQNQGLFEQAKTIAGKALNHIKTRWFSSLVAIGMIVAVWGFIYVSPNTTYSLLTFRAVAMENIDAPEIERNQCDEDWAGPEGRCRFLLVMTGEGDDLMEYANIDVNAIINFGLFEWNWGRWLIKDDSGRVQNEFLKNYQQKDQDAWAWVSWTRFPTWDWYPMIISSPRPLYETAENGEQVISSDFGFWKYGIWGVKAGIILLMALAFHIAFKMSGFGRYGWKALFFPVTALIFMCIVLPWKGLKALRNLRKSA